MNPAQREALHKKLAEQMIAYNDSLTPEEKIQGAKAMQEWHANLTGEAKKEFYKKTHAWYYALSDDDKETYSSFLTVLEKQFSYLKINFRQPNEDFKKFALMSSEEQKQYISNFVDEILDRLRVMKLL